MYAVVEIQWHQYIVSKWQDIVVDQMNIEEKKEVSVDTVLMVFDKDAKDVKIGKPHVDGVSVVFTVAGHQKWEKIRVVKFKNKNRYERNKWFTPLQTVLHVKDIAVNG